MNCHDIWQAAYTAGVVLPKPVAVTQYWHRSLNPKKLISVGFSRLQVSTPCSMPSNCCSAKPSVLHVSSSMTHCRSRQGATQRCIASGAAGASVENWPHCTAP